LALESGSGEISVRVLTSRMGSTTAVSDFDPFPEYRHSARTRRMRLPRRSPWLACLRPLRSRSRQLADHTHRSREIILRVCHWSWNNRPNVTSAASRSFVMPWMILWDWRMP